MKVRKLAPIAAAAIMAVGFAMPSAAVTYDFGTYLDGFNPGGGGSTWASLSILSNGGNAYTFTLNLLDNFDDVFGDGAKVKDAMFNNSGPITTTVGPTIVAGSWGVSSVSDTVASNLASITWDFGDAFSQGNDTLTSGESVSWTQTFADPLNLVNPYVTLHIQNITTNGGNGDSAHYIPGIPEPETYAMMLVGFGLLGFVAKRRKQRLGSVVPA